jgi:radical SAM protein with 4Fe4S-binding SPASM domain
MPFRETAITDCATHNLGFGIDITTHCNLDCITCYYLDSLENHPHSCDSHISIALFEKAMNQAAGAGFQEIYILGGEPTVHPRILDLLKCAGSFQFKQVLLVTNGIRLADFKFCKAIAATGAAIAVQRHVIGNGEIEHQVQDTLVGRRGTLTQVNQAFANIESLFEPERVAVQCCITRPTVERGHIYDVFRYAKSHHFEHIIECTKASERFQRGNPLDISPFELLEVYERLQRIDVDEFGGTLHPITPQAYGKTCHMPENSVHCLADGTIIPCVGQPFHLGNIFTNASVSLEDILHSMHRDFFRYPNKRLQGHCRNCSYLSTCTGGCRGDAFFLTGCFSASAIQCPQLAKYEKSLKHSDFIPSTCDDCALHKNSLCGPRKDVHEKFSKYFGSLYQGNESI